MLNLLISDAVRDKLRSKHQVEASEVRQCFSNRAGKLLLDAREQHQTDPPTLWFVAPTNRERLLKIVYIQKDGQVLLKTAFEPNAKEMQIYKQFGGAV
jgi:hypothetical protein